MNTVREMITELRLSAESIEREWPGMGQEFSNKADDLEWREQVYAEKTAKILAIVNPRYDAYLARISELRRMLADDTITRRQERELEVLVQRHVEAPRILLGQLSRYADREQCLFHFCAVLKVAFLLTPAEERAIGIDIPESPRRLAEIREAQAEIDHWRGIYFAIMETIPKGWQREEARRQFNLIGGCWSDDKIVRWKDACRGAGVLGDDWLPGRIFSALLNRVLRSREPIEKGLFLR